MSLELREETIRRSPRARQRHLAATRSSVGDDSERPSVVEMMALFYSTHDAESLRAAASRDEGARAFDLETFSPLYLTNTCDSECKMCGMRRGQSRSRAPDREPRADPSVSSRSFARRGVWAVAPAHRRVPARYAVIGRSR